MVVNYALANSTLVALHLSLPGERTLQRHALEASDQIRRNEVHTESSHRRLAFMCITYTVQTLRGEPH